MANMVDRVFGRFPESKNLPLPDERLHLFYGNDKPPKH